MRSISALRASEVSGPVARMVHAYASCVRVEPRDFFADHANAGLGRNSLGDAPRKLDAVHGQRVAGGHSGLIRNAQKRRARPPHLLLQQPRRRVGRLALERVGADQLAELDGLVGRRQPRLAVHDGPHLVEIHLAAQPRRGQRRFRPGQSAADHANSLHCRSSSD